MDGPILGRGGGPGVRKPSGARQRRYAQPVGLAAQTDVHANASVPRIGAQVGHQASAGAASGRRQRHQPGRLRGVFQVRRRGRRVPAQPHGVRRGQQVRQGIRVVAPWRPGALDVRQPDRSSGAGRQHN